jgi:DEAD/DEAH box helicase domain-containing protein
MRKIVFDIETANDFAEIFEPSKLDLSIICIWDSETDSYSSYTVEELPKLWPILEKADVLIGYNSDHFDIPVLSRYYPGDLTKIRSIDLLKEVRNVLGRRLKLDNLTQATLKAKKSADGAQAVRWWREGKVEKVRQYCLDDVRLTKELYDHIRTTGGCKYKDFDGVREIKIDSSNWESGEGNALTHTLPF